MQYQVIRGQDCHTGHWSGGSTTELFLWPQTASYADRNFSVRVSTATVEVDRSDFTPLPGYTRLLMTVRGGMQLQITGQGAVSLPPWQWVRFDGGAATTSAGCCVDFGVMLGAGWDGALQVVASGKHRCTAQGFTGIYAAAGPADIALEGGTEHLDRGDLLLVQGEGALSIHSVENAILFTTYQRAE